MGVSPFGEPWVVLLSAHPRVPKSKLTSQTYAHGAGTEKRLLAYKGFTNLVIVTKLYYSFYGTVTKV